MHKVSHVKSDKNWQFRSLAKLKVYELLAGGGQQHVFLDCNCLPVKNCDDLFRLNGVQWCGLNENGEKFAAIVMNTAVMRDFDLDKFVAEQEQLFGEYNNTNIIMFSSYLNSVGTDICVCKFFENLLN